MAFSSSRWNESPNTAKSDPLQRLSASLARHLPTAALIASAIMPAEKVDAATAEDQPRPPQGLRIAVNASQAAPVKVGNSGEVVAKWSAEQNLYICGDVGLGAKQAQDLAVWLRQYPNWTVYLTQRAEGEVYNDGTKVYNGAEAVEHRLGKELPSKTDFGRLADPRRGTPNGSILYISFDSNPAHRKVGYNSSATHDAYGLGRANWQGNLDQPAIERLRNGKRVVEAVQVTVSGIESRLGSAIAARAEQDRLAEEAARAEAARVQEAAKAAVASANAARMDLGNTLRDFKFRYPSVSGPLVSPNFAGIDKTLAEAGSLFNSKQYSQAGAKAEEAARNVGAIKKTLAEYPAGKDLLAATAKTLEQVGENKLAAGFSGAIDTAKDQLARAKAAWERGDADYQARLTEASNAASGIARDMAAAESGARLQKTLSVTGIGLFTLLLGGAGVLLNGRARSARKSAEKLIGEWEELLHRKFDALMALDDRLQVLSASSGDNYYQGKTNTVVRQIADDLAALWSYHTFTNEALEKAKGLARPSFANTFSAASYSAAVRLLKNEPIAFERGKQLEALLETAGKKAGREKNILAAALKDVAPFTLSFEQLQTQYTETARRLESNLSTLETAAASIGSTLQKEQARLCAIGESISGLEKQGAQDGLFKLEQYKKTCLPAAEKAFAAIAEKIARDPLGASEIAGEAQRDLKALGQLTELISAARQPEGSLVEIQSAAALLRGLKIDAPWIQEKLKSLSVEADTMVGSLVEGRLQSSPEAIGTKLDELLAAAKTALKITRDAGSFEQQEINSSVGKVEESRREIAAGLRIAEELVLHEKGCDPSVELDKAAGEMKAALAAVSKGQLPEAAGHFASGQALNKKALTLLSETQAALNSYAATLKCEEELQNTRHAEIEPHRNILRNLQTKYAEEALTLGSGDATHPRANDKLSDNIEETQKALAEAGQAISTARANQASGRILEAQFHLKKAAQFQTFANDRLAEIREKEARINRQLDENAAKQKELQQTERSLLKACENAQVMQKTIKTCQSLEAVLRAYQDAVTQPKQDPFRAAKLLSEAENTCRTVTRLIESDKALFEEAVRSGDAALNAINRAKRSLDSALKDEIPDGTNLTPAQRKFPELERALARVQAGYKVPHGDWQALDQEADRICAEALALGKNVQGHVEAGAAAISAMGSAKSSISSARSWHSQWNVSVPSGVGSSELNRGRRLLEEGDYAAAAACFSSAVSAADSAVAAAEREAHRQEEAYRLEQERIAEERRERERRDEESRRSSWESSSNSGFSSTSIGSSDSGFSSSNW